MHKIDKVFADYETFWGTKYSLRTQGMSYTDYINHEKFQIHGCSVAINKEEPIFLHADDTKRYFQDLRGRKMLYVAHNTLFDGMITSIDTDTPFERYFCTLAMVDALYQGGVGRGLDECMKTLLGWETGKTDIITKLKDVRTEDITSELWSELILYANKDLKGTQELYYQFGPSLPTLEHDIMNQILRMFVVPRLKFDRKVLDEACQEADDDRAARIVNAVKIIDKPEAEAVKILKGTKLFPDLLREHDIKVPMKKNPKGDLIPAFAKTDKPFQQMLESKDDTIRDLAQGRLAVKSTQAQTRAYRFRKLDEDMGCFPVAYNYARAHTWRVSGANKINPTNLGRGSKLRTCIVAPDGYTLGVADASQIECRTNGLISGQEDLLQLFRDKRDPYNDMARNIFGHDVDRKGNPDHFFKGFLGKTATLGLGFQMGGDKFKYTVERDAKVNMQMDYDMPIEEANRIVYNVYRPKNYKIVEMWAHCKEFLFCMYQNRTRYWDYEGGQLFIDGPNNKIIFPNGTWLYYPGLDYNSGSFTYLTRQGSSWKTKYIYGGLLCENIVQHFARNITSWHLTIIAERYNVVMHTYDENIALVPIAEADEGTEWMIEIMKIRPDWAPSIPLDAEGGHAREYSK